jgi:hypothetical protein
MTDCEAQLLSSEFVDRIRELRFDAIEYSKLRSVLEKLADEWREVIVIEKVVALELFILPMMTRASAAKLSGADSERLRTVADELEALVFRCLQRAPD